MFCRSNVTACEIITFKVCPHLNFVCTLFLLPKHCKHCFAKSVVTRVSVVVHCCVTVQQTQHNTHQFCNAVILNINHVLDTSFPVSYIFAELKQKLLSLAVA